MRKTTVVLTTNNPDTDDPENIATKEDDIPESEKLKTKLKNKRQNRLELLFNCPFPKWRTLGMGRGVYSYKSLISFPPPKNKF